MTGSCSEREGSFSLSEAPGKLLMLRGAADGHIPKGRQPGGIGCSFVCFNEDTRLICVIRVEGRPRRSCREMHRYYNPTTMHNILKELIKNVF